MQFSRLVKVSVFLPALLLLTTFMVPTTAQAAPEHGAVPNLPASCGAWVSPESQTTTTGYATVYLGDQCSSASIDWGDGTVYENVPTNQYYSHTYGTAGYYNGSAYDGVSGNAYLFYVNFSCSRTC
jgi:hypothetical protein